MTATEYIQFKAFARVDGLWVAVLWISSFLFYLLGLSRPTYGIVAMLLMLSVPFVLGILLKRYRNDVLNGIISFARGWGYTVLASFYGSLLFGLSVFAYFRFLDNGYLFTTLNQILKSAEMAPVIEQGNLGAMVSQSLEQMRSMRPIDLTLNLMVSGMMASMLLALPIAALLQKNGQPTNRKPSKQ